jgi:predicted MFS family arabinose efflux permease
VLRGAALAALLTAVAVAFADSAIVVLALPDLLRQYDVSINAVAWVVTGYNVAVAVGAFALVAARRRYDAARLALIGSLVFAAASLGCALAPNVGTLIGFRSVQGLAAAALLVGSLPVLSWLSPRGTALWAGAGVFGAALGPALGGALTDVFSWRAIFYAQAPVGLLGAAALVRRRGVPHPVFEPVHRIRLGAVALALFSAALVGLLFLAVVLLVDVWRLSPLGAGVVVSVIPLATLVAAPLAARAGSSAVVAGAILLAAGLAGMALLPSSDLVWIVAALGVAGLGFGLAMPRLTRSTAGATAVAIRHAGLVVGLLVITPLLTSDLEAAADRAKLRGIATVLDAPVPADAKVRLAIDLAPTFSRPARKELPDFERAVAGEHDPAITAIGRELDHVLQATVTRAFRDSFLAAALFALLAGIPAVSRRNRAAPVAALLVGVALVAAELVGGAGAYGARPKLLPPCASRPDQGAVLTAVDFLACRLGKSREQFVADTAAAGVAAVDFLKQVERLVSLIGA